MRSSPLKRLPASLSRARAPADLPPTSFLAFFLLLLFPRLSLSCWTGPENQVRLFAHEAAHGTPDACFPNNWCGRPFIQVPFGYIYSLLPSSAERVFPPPLGARPPPLFYSGPRAVAHSHSPQVQHPREPLHGGGHPRALSHEGNWPRPPIPRPRGSPSALAPFSPGPRPLLPRRGESPFFSGRLRFRLSLFSSPGEEPGPRAQARDHRAHQGEPLFAFCPRSRLFPSVRRCLRAIGRLELFLSPEARPGSPRISPPPPPLLCDPPDLSMPSLCRCPSQNPSPSAATRAPSISRAGAFALGSAFAFDIARLRAPAWPPSASRRLP